MAQQQSRPPTSRRARKSFSIPASESAPGLTRRPTIPGATLGTGGAKAHRTSKTQQKLVVLPSAPQTKPLPNDDARGDDEEEDMLGYETDAGAVRSAKSSGERWSKAERARRGCARLTAYCVARGLHTRQLAGFLRREHGVAPRAFDEAVYAMYHLPLLPGYGRGASVRSAAPAPAAPDQKALHAVLAEAEENGYTGTYFRSAPEPVAGPLDEHGFIASSPEDRLHVPPPVEASSVDAAPTDTEGDGNATAVESYTPGVEADLTGLRSPMTPSVSAPAALGEPAPPQSARVGEAVFFDYGVVVFFGLEEAQERAVLDDIAAAGILRAPIDEAAWEIEACHFEVNPGVAHPRIYNDFFTLKSGSHLLKLSIAHAFAQSTLLGRHESTANSVLSAPGISAIPRQLAASGQLTLKRREALRHTGRLFALRRDVNLLGTVLDVPELFWSEASLKDLYDAVREYMELESRTEALNEKLGVANDLLDAIHDHLNSSAMERITWIIIWLIVVACVVEMGEVVARLVVHTTQASRALAPAAVASTPVVPLARGEALAVLERMMGQTSFLST